MRTSVHASQEAEEALLGSILLVGDPRAVSGLLARGLRPEHFYWDQNGAVFKAAVSLVDRGGAIDPITLGAEMDRLGLSVDEYRLDYLSSACPSLAGKDAYADRVMELARWRSRDRATSALQAASERRDETAWARATARMESAVAGTRTESYSREAWGALLWDFFSASEEEVAAYAIPLPFRRLTEALAGGLAPGESLALSGPTAHGKSIFADMCLDVAAAAGKRCHLYMTEMTAINRGLRYLARTTGVPYLRQRGRRDLTDKDRTLIIGALSGMPYGCSVVADWDVEDIVRDALRARYDFVVIDLLHGFHYQDERDLDRLSKAVQRLARVSTTLDGHRGTAVCAVTHLKEEGLHKGRVPRPTISSIKGGSSIKQDCDFVAFVWQEQEDGGAPNGEGEIWLAKGRGSQLEKVEVALNSRRFQFDLRDAVAPAQASIDPPAPARQAVF